MEEEQVFEVSAAAQVEATSPDDLQTPSLAQSRKLVPWLSWQEWDYVRASFFSSSPEAIDAAIRRVAAWRGRGCLPGVVDVTAAIFEIQQRDPFFRKDLPRDTFSDSDEILTMLYCMSVMRLVNVVVDKVRPTRRMSLADAAIEIGVPRMIIDIRHEGSHRALPSLPIVREASVQALNWLKVYYWEQQRLKTCQQYESSESRKQVGNEQLLELVLRMKSGLSNKSSKIKKVLMQLHDTYSFGVVASTVNLMQKVVNCNQLMEVPLDLHSDLCTGTSGDWKILQRLISKLSKKAPHFLLNLLHAVLDMIEANKNEPELDHGLMAKYMKESDQAESLSSMFCWLVTLLKDVRHLLLKKPSSETGLPLTEAKLREAILEVLQKCLLVSAGGDKELLHSAGHLAEQLQEEFLIKKLQKLNSLLFAIVDVDIGSVEEVEVPFLLTEQEEFIKLAGQKLGSIGFNQANDINLEQSGGSLPMVRWFVTESWTPCPIGMLPHGLPTLDFAVDEVPESSDIKSNGVPLHKKRESTHFGDSADQPSSKRTQVGIEDTQLGGEKGFIKIQSFWERVEQQELHAIKSAVRRSWLS